jgi:hypothetical protein
MYTLTTEPFYDTYTQCYKNIITINVFPQGPLRLMVGRIQFNKLGPNRAYSNCVADRKCGLVIISRGNCGGGNGNDKYSHLMTPDEIPELFAFLTETGYSIDTSVTNMMSMGEVKLNNNRKILCFITYNGKK